MEARVFVLVGLLLSGCGDGQKNPIVTRVPEDRWGDQFEYSTTDLRCRSERMPCARAKLSLVP